MQVPDWEDIRQAAKRIAPFVKRTPVFTSETLNRLTGAHLFFKCENFQKVGAFKFRGACNAVFSLNDSEARKGVCTHSSGNHAAALSLAARLRGIPAYVVMPENSPRVKVDAVQHYGGQITFCAPTLTAREQTLQKIQQQTGAVFIHPYNNFLVVAGQGTVALEFLEAIPDLDILLAPVGGGGLMSGTCLAASVLRPDIQLIGAEPAAADDACRSLQTGKIIPPENPRTIADGLRTSLCPLTFQVLQQHLDSILTVSEEGIVQAMRLIWERMKIVVEPSAAVPFAAVLEHKNRFRNRRVGIILSGGNVDLDRLPWFSPAPDARN
ncbi:MAG: pyridoxal-phosphate dependent enzyme [Calditrichaeota bacterium]|nr:pyridoxal-phosphate dependent enzyme [Calditrichota bacterium]